MPSFNKVIIMGHLTRDPEVKYSVNKTAICNFGIATNRVWKDKETQEQKEEVCFIDCTAFGRRGEVISEYLHKGSLLHLEGRLQFSAWETEDRQKRNKLSVVVENFQFMGSTTSNNDEEAKENSEQTPAVETVEDIPF